MCWLLLMDQILVKYVSTGRNLLRFEDWVLSYYLKVGSSDLLIYSLTYNLFDIWSLLQVIWIKSTDFSMKQKFGIMGTEN